MEEIRKDNHSEAKRTEAYGAASNQFSPLEEQE